MLGLYYSFVLNKRFVPKFISSVSPYITFLPIVTSRKLSFYVRSCTENRITVWM